MIQLYQANVADVIAITKLLGMYWEENTVLGKSQFDPKSSLFKVRDAVLNGQQHIVLAYWMGELAGILWVQACENMGNFELYATDRLVYVVPEHRDKQIFLKLFEEFEAWCERIAIKHVRVATFGGSNNDGMQKFLSDRGYQVAGATFFKER